MLKSAATRTTIRLAAIAAAIAIAPAAGTALAAKPVTIDFVTIALALVAGVIIGMAEAWMARPKQTVEAVELQRLHRANAELLATLDGLSDVVASNATRTAEGKSIAKAAQALLRKYRLAKALQEASK
ncbi:MAG: hypothetical protein ACRC02_15770 [Vogesella sp.]|uniref:hypothetical protein n=1 Tax=Vogesella sp. TaxID=1904252 RepID=UPI003F3ADC3E